MKLWTIAFAMSGLALSTSACKTGGGRGSALKEVSVPAPASDQQVTCKSMHSGGGVDETTESVTFPLAPGDLTKILDSTKLTFTYDASSQVAAFRAHSAKAELGGDVKGLFTPGMKLSISTINDYGFGDGSDLVFSCQRGGTAVYPSQAVTKVTCKGLSHRGRVETETQEVSGTEWDGDFEIGGNSRIYYSAAEHAVTIWPYSDEHGGAQSTGYAPASSPLSTSARFTGAERSISCWVE